MRCAAVLAVPFFVLFPVAVVAEVRFFCLVDFLADAAAGERPVRILVLGPRAVGLLFLDVWNSSSDASSSSSDSDSEEEWLDCSSSSSSDGASASLSSSSLGVRLLLIHSYIALF